jgi:GAF domain-containing protein
VVDVLARRYVELENLAARGSGIGHLSIEVRVERGDAPAAGFEAAAKADTTRRDLLSFGRALADAEERSRALTELSETLAICSSREASFQQLRAGLKSAIAYDAMAVYHRRADTLFPEITDSEVFLEFLSVEIPVGQGLTGWVAENGTAIMNGNPAVEPGYLVDPSRFVALGSALAVPLLAPEGIAGVISLYRRGSDTFTREELAALTSLGTALANVLELLAHPEHAV